MDGIKRLLEAEKKAQDIVEAARKEKTQKLKQAQLEAQKDIEDYRKQRQTQFDSFSKKYMEGVGQHSARLQESTNSEIKKIESEVVQKRALVLDLLLKSVDDVYVPEKQ